MNFFGKTLIVLQLFLSLLFFCFAGAVYQFQGEWQKKAVAAQKQIDDLQRTSSQAASDADTKLTQSATDLAEITQERDALIGERDGAVSARNTAEAELAEVRQERDTAIAENERATLEAGSRRSESMAVNENISALRAANAEQMRRIRDTESENLDLSNIVASARHREQDHFGEIGRLRDLLRGHGVDPSSLPPGEVPTIAEKVEGVVELRRENAGRNQEFVQFSIGSDDKIQEDMVLIVSRGENFVADVRVFQVFPDKSIGIVIEDTRRDIVQEGDRATTKL